MRVRRPLSLTLRRLLARALGTVTALTGPNLGQSDTASRSPRHDQCSRRGAAGQAASSRWRRWTSAEASCSSRRVASMSKIRSRSSSRSRRSSASSRRRLSHSYSSSNAGTEVRR